MSSSSRWPPSPAFDGPLGELDRRAGGELRSLATFGELRGKRYAGAIAAAGEAKAGRLLTVGLGDPDTVDREVAVRVGAAAVRRLGGREVRRLAFWLDPVSDALGAATPRRPPSSSRAASPRARTTRGPSTATRSTRPCRTSTSWC